jgi:hypothetical protein
VFACAIIASVALAHSRPAGLEVTIKLLKKVWLTTTVTSKFSRCSQLTLWQAASRPAKITLELPPLDRRPVQGGPGWNTESIMLARLEVRARQRSKFLCHLLVCGMVT